MKSFVQQMHTKALHGNLTNALNSFEFFQRPFIAFCFELVLFYKLLKSNEISAVDEIDKIIEV